MVSVTPAPRVVNNILHQLDQGKKITHVQTFMFGLCYRKKCSFSVSVLVWSAIASFRHQMQTARPTTPYFNTQRARVGADTQYLF